MQYVDFGKTGIKVSRLGFGCMRLPMTEVGGKHVVDEDAAASMLRKGAELGINYFDSGYVYHEGMSEVILGRAVKGIRDKVFISTKSPATLSESPAITAVFWRNSSSVLMCPTSTFIIFTALIMNYLSGLSVRRTGIKRRSPQKKKA